MNQHLPRSTGDKVAAIVGLLILSVALRPAIVSIGPVLLQMQDHFRLSYAQASLLTSIPDVCMAVFALLAPRIARTFGTDNSVIAALVVLGVAIVLRALSPSGTLLLLSTVLVGVGIAIGGSLIGGWIKTHFAGQASFFMGIYAAGLSIGATVAAVSTEYVTEIADNWRIGAGVWAALCVTAIVSWVILARRFADPAPSVAVPARTVKAVALPWTNPKAWWVALYFGGSQFIVYALFAWLAPAASEMGISALKPGAVLGVFTSVFAVASFAMGSLAGQSRDRRGWLAVAMLLTALGAAGLGLLPAFAPMLSVILIAVGMGMAFTLAMTLPLDNANSAPEASAWTVFTLFIGYLIAATGPMVFGQLRELSGGYGLSCLLLTGVAIAMVCLTPMLKPQDENEGALLEGAARV
jgi:MFS transporter, CP family, cyanate transporter